MEDDGQNCFGGKRLHRCREKQLLLGCCIGVQQCISQKRWLITESLYHIAVMGKTVNVTKPSWDEVMNHSRLTVRGGIDEAAGKGFERSARGVYELSTTEPLTAGTKQIEFTGRSVYKHLSKKNR